MFTNLFGGKNDYYDRNQRWLQRKFLYENTGCSIRNHRMHSVSNEQKRRHGGTEVHFITLNLRPAARRGARRVVRRMAPLIEPHFGANSTELVVSRIGVRVCVHLAPMALTGLSTCSVRVVSCSPTGASRAVLHLIHEPSV